MSLGLLVFDMDGVLVDVSDSYRETIQLTVEHFTGRRISREFIQEKKNEGGWNDDWALSHHLIGSFGGGATHAEVVEYFQGLFLGSNGDGLIRRERWIARPGLFGELAASFRLALFTGRLSHEARLTLDRFAPELSFDPLVGSDVVTRHKPAPDGLLHILERAGERPVWYVGDTIDDARSASGAGVPFIGIAAPAAPRHRETVELLRAHGAVAVLDDINALPSIVAAGTARA